MIENYSKVRKELFKYSNILVKKREIVVLNKIDMINEKEINEKINVLRKGIKKKIFIISALKHLGLKDMKKNLFSYVL